MLSVWQLTSRWWVTHSPLSIGVIVFLMEDVKQRVGKTKGDNAMYDSRQTPSVKHFHVRIYVDSLVYRGVREYQGEGEVLSKHPWPVLLEQELFDNAGRLDHWLRYVGNETRQDREWEASCGGRHLLVVLLLHCFSLRRTSSSLAPSWQRLQLFSDCQITIHSVVNR